MAGPEWTVRVGVCVCVCVCMCMCVCVCVCRILNACMHPIESFRFFFQTRQGSLWDCTFQKTLHHLHWWSRLALFLAQRPRDWKVEQEGRDMLVRISICLSVCVHVHMHVYVYMCVCACARESGERETDRYTKLFHEACKLSPISLSLYIYYLSLLGRAHSL